MIDFATVLAVINPLPGDARTLGTKQLTRLGEYTVTAELTPTIYADVYSGITVRVLNGTGQLDCNVFDFATYAAFRAATTINSRGTVIDLYTQRELVDPGFLTPHALREAVSDYLAFFA